MKLIVSAAIYINSTSPFLKSALPKAETCLLSVQKTDDFFFVFLSGSCDCCFFRSRFLLLVNVTFSPSGFYFSSLFTQNLTPSRTHRLLSIFLSSSELYTSPFLEVDLLFVLSSQCSTRWLVKLEWLDHMQSILCNRFSRTFPNLHESTSPLWRELLPWKRAGKTIV